MFGCVILCSCVCLFGCVIERLFVVVCPCVRLVVCLLLGLELCLCGWYVCTLVCVFVSGCVVG